MNLNPLRLDEQMSPEDWRKMDALRDVYGELPRNIEEYWHAWHLSLDRDDVERRIQTAYGISDNDFTFRLPKCFITDDVNVFTEFRRHLSVDFVHDFKTGLFFMDLYANHQVLMGQLYEMNQKRLGSWKDAADEYVRTGMGVMKSSQSAIIFISPNIAIPDFLRPWKKDIYHLD